MAEISPQAQEAVERFCDSRVPEHVRDQIRLECTRRGNSLTIAERRPPWREEMGPEWSNLKVAQLRCDPDQATWRLYWRDSSERWHLYDRVEPSETVDPLLAEIDADPTAIFFG